MTRLYADMLSCVTVFIAVVLFLGGCVAPNPQVTAPTPQVIMQGDIPGKEVVQPIELDNCDGKADAKRIEHRTRSIESTISAEVAAKFGVSAEVLSAEVQATVGAAIGATEGQGTSIELVAPPGTRMAFQLVWIGNEQVGIVQNLRASNIPIVFRSFKPTDVRIKSQYDIGCPPSNTQPVQPIPKSAVIVRASDVIPKIKGEDGEIEKILSWWRVDDWGNKNGQLNPSSLVPDENCFGLAWNTNEFGDLRLIVFQKPRVFTFATGGWYVKVCIPKSIQISSEDVGKIQADWLSKRYGTGNDSWEVIIDTEQAQPEPLITSPSPTPSKVPKQSSAVAECSSTDYTPPLTGVHPPIDAQICIPSGKIAWISSDPAQISIPSINYNKTFSVGFTFRLFGPVRFKVSGAQSNFIWMDTRENTSLMGNLDGKAVNLVYHNGKVCDLASYTGTACP